MVYLQNLPNLRNLWLGENPCASIDGYRLAVIRALPQLQKLDNVAVTQEELKEAQRKGKVLTHPDDPQESEEEEYVQQPQYNNRYQEYGSEQEYSPQNRSPNRQEVKIFFYMNFKKTNRVQMFYIIFSNVFVNILTLFKVSLNYLLVSYERITIRGQNF